MVARAQDSPQQPHPGTSDINGDNDDGQHDSHSPWGWIIFAVLIALFLAGLGWLVYSRLRARRLGLPPPSLNPFSDRHRVTQNYPARGGIVGWATAKVRGLRNRRTAGGAYEGPSSSAALGGRHAARPGFGQLDPDEAWDARVGNEADYFEEQELGVRSGVPGAAARGYGPSGGLEEIDTGYGRGPHAAQEELDNRYDEEMGRKPRSGQAGDPFGDGAEASSMRTVSPRPHEGGRHQKNGSLEVDNPSERRSVFRENM